MISIPGDCRFDFRLEDERLVGTCASTSLVGLRRAHARWSQGDAGAIHRTDEDDLAFPRSVGFRVVFDSISGMHVIIQEAPGPIDVPTMVEVTSRCLDAVIHQDAGPDPAIDPLQIAIALAETARMRPDAALGVASAAMPWSPLRVFHRDADGRPWPLDVSNEIRACEAMAVPPTLRIDYHAPGRNPSIRIGRMSVQSPEIRTTPPDAVTVLRAMASLDRLMSRDRSTGDDEPHRDP